MGTKSRSEPHSKHEPIPVETEHPPSLRSRSHAERTPDGRYRCIECGQISNTLLEQDAHHFKMHQKQPPETYMHTAP